MVENPFDVDLKGTVKSDIVTFKHVALVEADVGKVVSVSADKTVALTANGSKFDGVLLAVDEKEKICSVGLTGVMECKYSGPAPGFGRALLVSDAAGLVKTDVAGEEHLVVSVDAGATTVQFMKR